MKTQFRNVARRVHWPILLIICWLVMITYANISARLERIEIRLDITTIETKILGETE